LWFTPLTVVGPDKTGPFGFYSFEQGLPVSIHFVWQHIFGDSAGESITSSTSSMKGGDSDRNGSDLDKCNILKPTFDTLTEEGRKAFEAYHTNLVELFLSHCEVT
jgi:hypothetical protein